jgi:hypothetical protein
VSIGNRRTNAGASASGLLESGASLPRASPLGTAAVIHRVRSPGLSART